MTRARARTRRRLAGLAASLGVHLALLAAFMSVAPRLVTVPYVEPPPAPAIEVELQRRAPASSGSSAATPRPTRAVTPPTRPPLLPTPQPLVRPNDLPAPALSAPSTRPGAQGAAASAEAAAGAAPNEGRWRVKGGGDAAGDAARAFARGTIGCGATEWLHLTADERDHCNAEFVRGMRTLKVDSLPAAKRAYYDAVVAKIEEARNLPAAAPHQPPLTRSHGLDATMGVNCAFRFGPGAARANRDDPCRVHLPFSTLTAETRAPPPASLADQTADRRAAAKLDAPALSSAAPR